MHCHSVPSLFRPCCALARVRELDAHVKALTATVAERDEQLVAAEERRKHDVLTAGCAGGGAVRGKA